MQVFHHRKLFLDPIFLKHQQKYRKNIFHKCKMDTNSKIMFWVKFLKYIQQTTKLMCFRWVTLPFQSLTQPSSPEEASTVPVIFQLTRHTWELWLSNCATIWISNFVNPPDEVNSFLFKRKVTVLHTTVQRSRLKHDVREDYIFQAVHITTVIRLGIQAKL